MKKLCLVLALLLLCGCAREQTPATEPPEILQTEPAETQSSVTELTVPTETSAPTEPLQQGTVSLLTRLTALSEEDGSVRWYMEYTYDEYGRLSTEREVLYDGTQSYFASYSYIKKDGVLETYRTAAGENNKLLRREFFDDQGNLIGSERIGWDDGVADYTDYAYDTRGCLVEETSGSPHESSVYTLRYTYDEAGNRTEICRYRNGELEGRSEQTYDEENRLTGSTTYRADGTVSENSIIQWEGNASTQTWYMDGSVSWIEINTYDEYGNIIRNETRNGDGRSSVKEYVYELFTIYQ